MPPPTTTMHGCAGFGDGHALNIDQCSMSGLQSLVRGQDDAATTLYPPIHLGDIGVYEVFCFATPCLSNQGQGRGQAIDEHRQVSYGKTADDNVCLSCACLVPVLCLSCACLVLVLLLACRVEPSVRFVCNDSQGYT